jgi:peptide/nickel transport system permease protein
MDQAQIDALREQYGLDQPMIVQYFKWVGGMLRGDFGVSLDWKRPIMELIKERLLLTVLLGAFTFIISWSLAIPIGIISATKQYSFIDYFFTIFNYMGVATPTFMTALILMWLAYSYFGISVTGLFSPEYVDAPWSLARVVDLMKHLWLPALILALDGTARLARVMRANLLDELNKPYVEMARAKGMSEWRLVLKYPVHLAINPLVSTIGWYLPMLFSGSVIVATVLNLPTIGPLLLRSLTNQDMFLAGVIVLIYCFLAIIGTLMSDVLLAWLDPRIRMEA